MKFVNANGGKINHYGSRKVLFAPKGGQGTISMGFEVTDVKKPLLAVVQLCKAGNKVQFGDKPEDNYIQNVSTGKKLFMRKMGNSFVLDGEVVSPF